VVPPRLEVRAVLGNIELDLRDAEFGSGITEISVHAILGNVEISLPTHVAVENHGSAVLGSFAARAKRGARRTATASTATVRITGRALLGNVEFESKAGDG
jgi:predicted membrane protein